MRAANREVKALLNAALDQGCEVSRRRSGHFFVKPPGETGREIVVVSATPSDSRALKNARAQLRRNGIALP